MTNFVCKDEALLCTRQVSLEVRLASVESHRTEYQLESPVDQVAKPLIQLHLQTRFELNIASRYKTRDCHDLGERRGDISQYICSPQQGHGPVADFRPIVLAQRPIEAPER